MRIIGQSWFVILVLAAIFLIFVLPGVSLCPTAMRAIHNAACFFFALVSAATVCLGQFAANGSRSLHPIDQGLVLRLAPLQRSCVIRC